MPAYGVRCQRRGTAVRMVSGASSSGSVPGSAASTCHDQEARRGLPCCGPSRSSRRWPGRGTCRGPRSSPVYGPEPVLSAASGSAGSVQSVQSWPGWAPRARPLERRRGRSGTSVRRTRSPPRTARSLPRARGEDSLGGPRSRRGRGHPAQPAVRRTRRQRVTPGAPRPRAVASSIARGVAACSRC